MPSSKAWDQKLKDQKSDDVSNACHREDEQRMEGEEMRDQPGKAGSSKGSCGASNANDSADTGRGEHIRWCGEDVGRPALVCGCGETEEADCRPRIVGEECVHVRDEHDGKNAQSTDQEGELSAGVDTVAVLHPEA